jgi:hypothetical protein
MEELIMRQTLIRIKNFIKQYLETHMFEPMDDILLNNLAIRLHNLFPVNSIEISNNQNNELFINLRLNNQPELISLDITITSEPIVYKEYNFKFFH